MTITAGTRLGPYEVVAPLGAGGMGAVWRGRDTRLERSVAIKVLPAEFAENAQLKLRFEREARTISQLNHPHICTLYDVGEGYLVMELLEGETLADRVARGPLSVAEVLKYGVQIAEALEKAHKAGVVHRDLKPGNVMITKAGAKLLDFGLAKDAAAVFDAEGPTRHRSLTAEGTIIGTLNYMAPEQLEGGLVDARTDIFALGAVLYEMATGRRAFEGKSKASLIANILAAEPPPISAIQPMTPPSFDRIVRACLAKDPDERWQSGHDVATELQWISEGIVESPDKRRHSRVAWSATAFFAAATAILGFLLWRSSSSNHPAIPIRMEMLPPEKTEFQFTGAGFPGAPPALSPDGTKLVFGAAEPGKSPELWLRSFQSTIARRIPGTAGASYPFWSPDSRWIAFFADNALKKVDIAGGAPVVLCSAGETRGGSWSPNGSTIIFAGRYAPIYRVPSGGGTPVAVTALDLDKRDTSHRWPEFLDDNTHFLFLACPTGAEDPTNTICVGSIDEKMRKPLISSANNPVLFKDEILFTRNNVLMMQRFDAQALVVTSEAVPLQEQSVENAMLFSRSAFTVSRSGTLVYQPAVGARDTQLSWFDRAGKPLGQVGEPALYGMLALSPDQRRVAAAFSNTGNIWAFELERGIKSRVTFHDGHDMLPVWSPEGSRLAYSTLASGGMALYLKDLRTGSDEELVKSPSGIVMPTSWSLDGRILIYTVTGRTTRTDIWSMSLVDRKSHLYLGTPFIETQGRLSPDGKWMAYQSTETGAFDVFIAPFPPTGAKWQVSAKGGAVPRWRSDGGELYYVRDTNTIVAVPITLGETPEIGRPSDLFRFRPGTVAPVAYDVSSDGKRFLVNIATGDDSAKQSLIVVEHFDAEVAAARKGHQ